MRVAIIAILPLALASCFPGDDDAKQASRQQIIDAAARCGIRDFQPTNVGDDNWAAYGPGEKWGEGPKSDCIYAELKRQGLVTVR